MSFAKNAGTLSWNTAKLTAARKSQSLPRNASFVVPKTSMTLVTELPGLLLKSFN